VTTSPAVPLGSDASQISISSQGAFRLVGRRFVRSHPTAYDLQPHPTNLAVRNMIQTPRTLRVRPSPPGAWSGCLWCAPGGHVAPGFPELPGSRAGRPGRRRPAPGPGPEVLAAGGIALVAVPVAPQISPAGVVAMRYPGSRAGSPGWERQKPGRGPGRPIRRRYCPCQADRPARLGTVRRSGLRFVLLRPALLASGFAGRSAPPGRRRERSGKAPSPCGAAAACGRLDPRKGIRNHEAGLSRPRLLRARRRRSRSTAEPAERVVWRRPGRVRHRTSRSGGTSIRCQG